MLYVFLVGALLLGVIYVQVTVNTRLASHGSPKVRVSTYTTPDAPETTNVTGHHALKLNYTSTKHLMEKLKYESKNNTRTKESKYTPRPDIISNGHFRENIRPGKCHTRQKDGRIVCMPDFFFIGCSKAGTTSLAYYLDSHPMIVNANGINHGWESHRFDPVELDSLQGVDSPGRFIKKFDSLAEKEDIYKDQPGFRDVSNSGSRKHQQKHQHVKLPNRPLVMEYTPNYIMVDEAPLLIAKTYPDIATKLKFVLLVREPVSRMISSWRFKTWTMQHNHPDEKTMSFSESVKSGVAQLKCIEECFKHLFNDSDPTSLQVGGRSAGAGIDVFRPLTQQKNWENRLTSRYNHIRCSIRNCRIKNDDSKKGWVGGRSLLAHVAKGLYAYQLLNWFSVFDRSQFLVLSLEELIESPKSTLRKVTDFLGLHMFHDKALADKYMRKIIADSGYSVDARTRNDQFKLEANIFLHKDEQYIGLKDWQQRIGLNGWFDEKQLDIYLTHVLNSGQTDHSLDAQITPELVRELENAYELANKRFTKLLNWPDNYY